MSTIVTPTRTSVVGSTTVRFVDEFLGFFSGLSEETVMVSVCVYACVCV